MKLKERVNVVRAMETIARCINDEMIFDSWLMVGVADGDIAEDTEDEDLEYYCEDDNFAELMDLFLRLMTRTKKSGGLYCDGVVSKEAD
mgnify:CR=1 FL=1